MRIFDIYVFIIVLNVLFTTFNSLAVYTDDTGTEQTLDPGFRTDPNLTRASALGNVGCSLFENGSYSCIPPSALESPEISSSVFTFGYFAFGLDFLFKIIGIGGFMYGLLVDFWVPTTFAIVIAVAFDALFIIAVIGMITGRAVEN